MATNKPEKKTVWMSCRGSGGRCDGNQMTLIRSTTNPLEGTSLVAGTTLTYRCQKCGRQFAITY